MQISAIVNNINDFSFLKKGPKNIFVGKTKKFFCNFFLKKFSKGFPKIYKKNFIQQLLILLTIS